MTAHGAAAAGLPAAAAAAAGDGQLAAAYAAVQLNLRKQYFADLVDLRGALLNTMNLEPHRGGNLQQKMQLIDGALHLLEVGAARGGRRRRSASPLNCAAWRALLQRPAWARSLGAARWPPRRARAHRAARPRLPPPLPAAGAQGGCD